LSPDVGELDEATLRQALDDDPDSTLALVAEMTGATDPRLREQARRLAARLFLDVARRGTATRRGVGRLVELPYRPDGGDLDLDASIDAITDARAGRSGIDPERLRVRSWTTPDTALCLLLDRSGSMTGRPLATSALATAAIALRSRSNYSVVAFARDAVVVKSHDADKAAERVVLDVLALRGHGTTDVAAALRAAAVQLGRSRASRRIAVLLSDCRSTVGGDVVGAAQALDELVILAPAGDDEDAVSLARATPARMAIVDGPSAVVDALRAVLDR
jgi:hypothetical protein